MEGGKDMEKRGFPVVSAEYKLLEEVGQGVSATVYRAKCLPLDEVVAIKSLDLEKCISNLDEIRREAQMMSLISHPNVVKAYCSFVVDRSLWVVMPYMAGGSCLHIMKSAYPDGLEEPIIATLLKEVLKALEYLHRHGHIHRDVKAGNILVDSNGSVKLGDFGVSACLFDTGDRQRSRNTFVGTPCWMAPEVMEQLHGYDFKADIWSFGITALELAHGHAPFSKYPPMKVLLMTLQNAPPGLDYERDKRFSKSFKEMIAMCLVKDPAKRPSAEKLLKHSFFKHAKNSEYVVRHVLDGLLPLGQRVMDLKLKDADRLAQKKMPYGEQEERSQNEYKRGVSSWNFNVEDLKAQAAIMADDEETASIKEETEFPRVHSHKETVDMGRDSLETQSLPSEVRAPLGVMSPRAESGAPERVTRARSGPLPTMQVMQQPIKSTGGAKSGPLNLGRKEPRHIGRFDVFEDDADSDRPSWHDDLKLGELRRGDDKELSFRKDDKDARKSDEQERDREEIGGASGFERVTSKGRDDDRDRDYRQVGRAQSGEDLPRINVFRERSSSGPLNSSGKDVAMEEKLKGTVVQKKGRFHVTSEEGDVPGPQATARKSSNLQTLSLHKSASVGDWSSERKHAGMSHSSSASQSPSHKAGSVSDWSIERNERKHAGVPHPPSSTSLPLSSLSLSSSGDKGAATVPVAAIFPHLQNLLQFCSSQQEVIVHLMNSLNPADPVSAGPRLTHIGSKNVVSAIANTGDSTIESHSSHKELLQQVGELQHRVANLVDELQVVKMKNVQLERQLNAIYNKEEEERIRKEEAAKGDG